MRELREFAKRLSWSPCSPFLRTVAGPDQKISVGFGWRIYVYLDRGDWIWLAGLGFTAGAAALCTALLSGGVASGVACAVAAYIVGTWVINYSAPPSGWCREFKFYYWGGFDGTKLVKRSC